MNLVGLDVETTGLYPSAHRIVQIALVTYEVISPLRHEFVSDNDERCCHGIDAQNICYLEKVEHLPIVKEIEAWSSLVNPGILIPASATKVHSITDETVRDAPSFLDIADEVFKRLDGQNVCGYNVSFDLSFLYEEFKRLDRAHPGIARIYDSLLVFRRNEHRTLSKAVKFYLNEDHTGAHEAEADARASVRVLAAQSQRYGRTLEEL
jgi:DNA polymerase III epsilon subunit family exonuclease